VDITYPFSVRIDLERFFELATDPSTRRKIALFKLDTIPTRSTILSYVIIPINSEVSLFIPAQICVHPTSSFLSSDTFLTAVSPVDYNSGNATFFYPTNYNMRQRSFPLSLVFPTQDEFEVSFIELTLDDTLAINSIAEAPLPSFSDPVYDNSNPQTVHELISSFYIGNITSLPLSDVSQSNEPSAFVHHCTFRNPDYSSDDMSLNRIARFLNPASTTDLGPSTIALSDTIMSRHQSLRHLYDVYDIVQTQLVLEERQLQGMVTSIRQYSISQASASRPLSPSSHVFSLCTQPESTRPKNLLVSKLIEQLSHSQILTALESTIKVTKSLLTDTKFVDYIEILNLLSKLPNDIKQQNVYDLLAPSIATESLRFEKFLIDNSDQLTATSLASPIISEAPLDDEIVFATITTLFSYHTKSDFAKFRNNAGHICTIGSFCPLNFSPEWHVLLSLDEFLTSLNCVPCSLTTPTPPTEAESTRDTTPLPGPTLSPRSNTLMTISYQYHSRIHTFKVVTNGHIPSRIFLEHAVEESDDLSTFSVPFVVIASLALFIGYFFNSIMQE
jgi:hypothetical protein